MEYCNPISSIKEHKGYLFFQKGKATTFVKKVAFKSQIRIHLDQSLVNYNFKRKGDFSLTRCKHKTLLISAGFEYYWTCLKNNLTIKILIVNGLQRESKVSLSMS